MHEKEILQNLAKSGQLASQTHTRALTHSLLNKALRCSLIQGTQKPHTNVSSNSDSQPPADTSTTRCDQFKQQSHFCCNCGSQDGVLKFQNRDEYRAIKRDLHDKLHHHCPNCQHTNDLPNVNKNTWQGRKQESLQQSMPENLCHRCMAANVDNLHLKTDTDVEDVSEDEQQQCVKQSTSLPSEKTRGTRFLGRMSDCQCDGPNGNSQCKMQKGRQPVLPDVFQPIRETNIVKMDVSREDRSCSYGEKGVVSLREKANNEWYKRSTERQAYQSCSHCQQCIKCLQPLKQNGQDLSLQEGQSQEHQRNCQQFIGGNDGEVQQSRYNLETDRRTELWSKATNDHGYMASSESQIYNKTDEDQPSKRSYEEQKYKRFEEALHKRLEDQKYKRSEDQQYKRSEDQKYKIPEDQQYKRPEDQQNKRYEDQQYKRSEDQQYKRSEDQQYKRSEDQQNKRSEDQHYKQSEEPLYKRSEDQQYKRPEDQQYKKPEDQQYKRSEDQQYKRSEDQQYKKPEDQQYKRSEDQQYKKPEDQQYKKPEDQQYKRSEDQQYKRSEDQQYKKPEDQQYKRSEDQQYKKPEDQQYKRSEDQQYKRSEDQQYKRSEDQQYKRSEDQQNERPEDQQYKRSEEPLYKRSEDQQYKQSEEPLYKRPEDRMHKISEDQHYKRSHEDHQYKKSDDQMYISEDQEYMKPSEDLQYRKQQVQHYTGTNDDQHKKSKSALLHKKSDEQQHTGAEDESYKTSIEDHVSWKQNNDLLNERINTLKRQHEKTSYDLQNEGNSKNMFVRTSGITQTENVSHDWLNKATSDNIFVRTSDNPQSENVSRDLLSKGSSHNPQSVKVIHDMLNKGTNDNIFVRTNVQLERTSDDQQYKRTGDYPDINTIKNQQFLRASHDQPYPRTSDKQQSERFSHLLSKGTSDNIFVRTNSNPQSERVIHDQQYTRTSHDQQYKRTGDYPDTSAINNQQFVRTSDNPDTRTSNNQQHLRTSENQQCMRTCGNQKLMRARDAKQHENNTAVQLPESEDKYKRCSDSPQSRTGSDHHLHTSSSRKQEYISDHGNTVSCFTCMCRQKLDGQKCKGQMSAILNERCAEWSKMDEAERQDKYNFDAAMKQMSEYMNGISLVCECYYESCSKDNLSMLERRHLRMFHKGVLAVKQQPQKTPDTPSKEDTTGLPHHCPCFSSVSRPPREGRSRSEDRSQRQTPGTDRSQNFVRFSDAAICQDPHLEDDSQSGHMFHRENKSQSSGRSQATGRPQFCVRFSDTGAEINQANKNSHHTEMSETCSSSLTSECQLKDLSSPISSHEDRKPTLSTESATDNTVNSQSYEAVLANCTPSFDSSQADSKPGSSSLKHLVCAQKPGHKAATNTRNRFLVQQRLNSVPGTHLPHGVFVEGISAFPTKASKMLSKSSKHKVRSGRNNTEQGIFIRTKPGSYIVKKPKEDSSIHLLQVNPGNYVKLNM